MIKIAHNKLAILMIFFVVSSIMISAPVQAGILDPILDPIQDLFNSMKDDIEDELERSRVGRELNRIVEDIDAVVGIVQEYDNLVVLAASSVTPVGFIALAAQYEHDPDQIFARFQERVDTLRNNHPGGGNGPGGELSNNEAAVALQTVLEEPILPEGVYMGDTCIIDLTSCPDESENSQPRYRAHYWDYSCYVEGTVGKKKVNGRNRAVCENSWLNTVRGAMTTVQFPADPQYGRYEWETCGSVYLTQQEQNSFIASKNCQQPIAKHDVGDTCVVDYTNCGYGAYAGYDANRIGTINYGVVRGERYRQEFACEISYGNYALKASLRNSCSHVYVGDREVNEYLAANPEPSQTPVAPPVNTTSAVIVPAPVIILPGVEAPIQIVSTFNRQGMVVNNTPQSLIEKKRIALDNMQQHDVVVIPQVMTIDENAQNPKVLPGNPLYLFKSFGQKVRYAFTFDEKKKVNLKMKYADLKLQEVKKLKEKGDDERAEKHLKNYEEDVEELDKVDDSEVKEKLYLDKYKHKVVAASVKDEVVIEEKVVEKVEEKIEEPKKDEKKVEDNIEEKIDETAKKEAEEKAKADEAEKQAALEKEMAEKKAAEEKALQEKLAAQKQAEYEKMIAEKEAAKKQAEEDAADEDEEDDVDPCAGQAVNQVCGADGKTYSNSCVAGQADVSIVAKGACVADVKK